MSTMNISLPDDMKGFVDQQVASRGYGTSSEFVRDLIRKEQERQHLRSLILAGIASGVDGPMDDAYFERLRERVSGSPKATTTQDGVSPRRAKTSRRA